MRGVITTVGVERTYMFLFSFFSTPGSLSFPNLVLSLREIGKKWTLHKKKHLVMLSQHRLFIRPWRLGSLSARPQSGPIPLLPATQGSFDTCRPYSTPARRPSFFGQFVENVKQDMAKNKELKESLKKFREEREKLEQSEALQKARTKFQAVESEASKSSEVLKDKLGTIKDKVHEALEEAGKSDIAKKAGQLTEGIGKTARDAAETITEQSQKIGQSEAFKTISNTAKAVHEELRPLGSHDTVYRQPVKLRKRKEVSEDSETRIIEPNTDATGVELHKDSRFYQSWQNFKENNPYVHKVLDWKMKYDESENPVIRASRMLTEKVSDIMGGLFQKTELSETLTEICKLDPNFDKAQFLKDCETDFIPNILEAMFQGDLEILKDWCHDGPYNILSKPILEARHLGAKFDSKILDVDNVDLAMGKMMEQGPVLVITFTTQQVVCVRDATGKVLDGDPEKILRVNYVWVMCRDTTEMDPRAAWRLLELSASSQEQLL